jgi:glycosyltransferase involved in cell wall biosynthesis
VSIVMPTRGRQTYIRRAVASVLRQSLDSFELIILDNTPGPEQDAIRNISTDPRIRFVDRGDIDVTAARKLGADLSRGKLFALLDSDDYWEPERLEKHVRVWSDNRIGLSWDRWVEVGEGAMGELLRPFPAGLVKPPKVAVRLFRRNFIHASSGIVSTRFARSLGFPFPRIISSDWTLFMRAAEYYPAYFIDETLSFKEVDSPQRITDTKGQDFFSWETITVKRWSLIHRPRIYAVDYLRRKARKRFRAQPKGQTTRFRLGSLS